MAMSHLDIKIYGKVQGVFFRHTAKRIADRFGVNGWIRNEPDGTVLVKIEGEEEKLRLFLEWCWIGPSSAVIEKIDVNEGVKEGFDGFYIN